MYYAHSSACRTTCSRPCPARRMDEMRRDVDRDEIAVEMGEALGNTRQPSETSAAFPAQASIYPACESHQHEHSASLVANMHLHFKRFGCHYGDGRKCSFTNVSYLNGHNAIMAFACSSVAQWCGTNNPAKRVYAAGQSSAGDAGRKDGRKEGREEGRASLAFDPKVPSRPLILPPSTHTLPHTLINVDIRASPRDVCDSRQVASTEPFPRAPPIVRSPSTLLQSGSAETLSTHPYYPAGYWIPIGKLRLQHAALAPRRSYAQGRAEFSRAVYRATLITYQWEFLTRNAVCTRADIGRGDASSYVCSGTCKPSTRRTLSLSHIVRTRLTFDLGDPGSIPGRATPDFRTWESCRAMPLVGGPSRRSPATVSETWARENADYLDCKLCVGYKWEESSITKTGEEEDNIVVFWFKIVINQASEASMEQCRNEVTVETGDPRENPPSSGIVRHDTHMRKPAVTWPWIEPGSPWWEASRLTAQPTVALKTETENPTLLFGDTLRKSKRFPQPLISPPPTPRIIVGEVIPSQVNRDTAPCRLSVCELCSTWTRR
ncbi:hypothetical protein PR048_000275 [Dryococelus australis]|uniref:Uncharacterized protein n=1 Tax=Dryococelus australis TaxID=614101 RepID=A0ABQ9IES2_9NEOP|nr:hypothetical protein PR048_000275 [Dryococelus australis]